jgi:hypothetical protein
MVSKPTLTVFLQAPDSLARCDAFEAREAAAGLT